MFTKQAPLIAQSLWQGGLSPAQAHVVTNALGQCRAPLIHRGPVQIDYTSPDMKLITPELAKFRFPELQLNPPEVFPNSPNPIPEEKPVTPPNPFPQPRPTVPVPVTPPGESPLPLPTQPSDYDDSWIRAELDRLRDFIRPQYLGVDDGAYIDVWRDGYTAKQMVALDAEDSNLHCVFRNAQVQSNKFTAENFEQDEPGAYLEIKEETGETKFQLTAGKPTVTTYVKDIWFDPGTKKINVQYEMAGVYQPADVGIDDKNLPIAECNAP